MILEAARPTDPKAFGERLERLRVARGLRLEDICGTTKISRRLLTSLEAGEFGALPERVFCRSFVRQIAAILAVDPEGLVTDFDRAWELYRVESGEHEPLPTVEPPPRPTIRWRFWFPISVCGALVLGVTIVILSGSEPSQAALVEQPRRHPQRSFSAAPAAHEGSASVALAAADPASEGLVDLKVVVDEEEECWVRYRDREGRTEQRLLPGGEELELRLEGPVKLTVGNASAARLVVDGVEYADLGVPGQVVHAEVSRHGVTAMGVGLHYD
jgi:cytoskeletal protein RodZ